MRAFSVLALLATLSPGLIQAQTVSASDPEMAVAAAIAGSLAPGRVAFDTRSEDGPKRQRVRSPERALAIARVLHGDALLGEKVLVCTPPDPGSCSLGPYAFLVKMSEPLIAQDGKSAKVTVVTHSTTKMPRIPVRVLEVEYTVIRVGNVWRVVSQRATRVS